MALESPYGWQKVVSILQNFFGICLVGVDNSNLNLFFANLLDDQGTEVSIGLTNDRLGMVFYDFSEMEWSEMKKIFLAQLKLEDIWKGNNLHISFNLQDFLDIQQTIRIYSLCSQV